MNLKEVRNLTLGRGRHFTWRLHDLSEERERTLAECAVSGVEAFQTALKLMEEGDREGAVASFRHATCCAEKAIKAIEG